MECPNCKAEMLNEECTYTQTSGKLGSATLYSCLECGMEFERRMGKSFMIFDGIASVDTEIKKMIW